MYTTCMYSMYLWELTTDRIRVRVVNSIAPSAPVSTVTVTPHTTLRGYIAVSYVDKGG